MTPASPIEAERRELAEVSAAVVALFSIDASLAFFVGEIDDPPPPRRRRRP